MAASGRKPYRRSWTRPTEHPTIRDVAWAAGFLEGEGSFIFNKGGNTQMVSAAQKEREPLDRLRTFFGGTVLTKPNVEFRSGKARADKIHVWQLYGINARGCMLTLFSFLSRRRRNQVRIAMGV